MSKFELLFGLSEQEIGRNCVLLPFVTKYILNLFGFEKLNRGKLYSAAGRKTFSVIHTGTGASKLGDAVLFLKETPCENIILFGACGLVRKRNLLDVGSLVCPVESLDWESFSQVLTGRTDHSQSTRPDPDLVERFLGVSSFETIEKVRCASYGSLKLEEENIGFLQENRIDVVDMECSACFNASRHIQRRAMALLFVSDILLEKPFFSVMDPQTDIPVRRALKTSAQLIRLFISHYRKTESAQTSRRL